MKTYTVKTDAAQMDMEASSFDEAITIFARTENGSKTWAEFCQYIDDINDGAWVWAQNNDTGERLTHYSADKQEEE